VATREDVETAATAARAAWHLPAGPVANVVRLLEAHGAVVATFAAGARRLSAFSQWHGERPIVVLCSDKADKARSRYDATHELGHLALHADPEPGNNVLEQQAEEFASAFLMPADDIRPHLPHGRIDWPHLQRLKRTWGVSMQALLVRAHRLGTISDGTFQNAFRYLSRQGWRRREPVDLGPLEEPQLFARAFALLEKKGIEPVDLFGALALPQRYAVELVGDHAASASADSGDVVALPRRPVTAAPSRNAGP
jgi:Zn-dependent peptidase ImmA (M78 family)